MQLNDLRQLGILSWLEEPTQNGGMKPKLKIRSQKFFFVSPRWGKSKKRILNAIERPLSTRLLALLGIAHPKWWHETEIVKFDPNGVFSFRPDGESRTNAF